MTGPTWVDAPEPANVLRPTGWWVTPDVNDFRPADAPWDDEAVWELALAEVTTAARAAALIKVGQLMSAEPVSAARSLALMKFGLTAFAAVETNTRALDLARIYLLTLNSVNGHDICEATLGSPPNGTPVLATISATGAYTYTIPRNCDFIDIILLGGGGGGVQGGNFNTGTGGSAGAWAGQLTIRRGIDIPWTMLTITGSVGAAGPAANNSATPNPAGNAGPTTAVLAGVGTLTAAGGLGGGNVGTYLGASTVPASQVINGQTYAGGVGGNTVGAVAPTGNGAGGFGGGTFSSGGSPGTAGRAWFYAYK